MITRNTYKQQRQKRSYQVIEGDLDKSVQFSDEFVQPWIVNREPLPSDKTPEGIDDGYVEFALYLSNGKR